MALWPAPRGRIDDWSVSATAPAAASGKAPNPTKSVTLTQARFFMDDFHTAFLVTGGPQRVIGDTAYGNVEVREQLEQRSISVLAPVHSSSRKEGTIAKEEFAIDLQSETVTCPRGKTAPIYKSRPRRPNANLRASRPKASGDRVARFARTDCEPCPLRPRCAPGGRREVRISRREDLRQAALQALSDPAERDHLKRTRPRIERLLGLVVYRYGGRKSRYLGTRKAAFQAVWTAVLVNLHPIAAALRANPA